MRCKLCGHIVQDGKFVCSYCGTPMETAPFLDTDSYVSIGHPLGYTKNTDEKLVVCLDVGDRLVKMSEEEYRIWNTLKEKSEMTDALERLVLKKLILNLKKKSDNMQFMHCTLSRQGVGTIYKGKHSIQLGIMPIHITEVQMKIWRMANGTDTVAMILQKIAEEPKYIVENILILCDLDLVYVRYKGNTD